MNALHAELGITLDRIVRRHGFHHTLNALHDVREIEIGLGTAYAELVRTAHVREQFGGADERLALEPPRFDPAALVATGDRLVCRLSVGSCRVVLDASWEIGRRDAPLMPGDAGIGGDWAMARAMRAAGLSG